MKSLRLIRVATILLRHRLDELVDATLFPRPIRWFRALLPRPRGDLAALPRGARLRLALIEIGPIFVKFGQILSTRRDLIPADVAEELAQLQDQVPPFPGAEARRIVEAALGAPIDLLYASFDETPLASASIAQVHAATLPDGRSVVVKVLRPDIRTRIEDDVKVLDALARLAERWHPNAARIRPLELAAETEKTLRNELDLQREAANASLLGRNYADGRDLYVPAVHWPLTTSSVMTLERVVGVPSDEIARIDQLGIDRRRLAAKGVRLFYEQVFRDNFFHADAHPGNIWVDPTRREDPRFIALDFGIMGSLPEADQYWLAENFIALFERDYRRIATLHVAAGWIPATVRLDELEAATRTVCEPYFTRPLAEISLAEVAMKLFQTARAFDLTIQPQLILLQKTLLNIEGLGRQLDPSIDIWAVAHPVLKRILRERYSLRRSLREIRRQLPQWINDAPHAPALLRDALAALAQRKLPPGAVVVATVDHEALARSRDRRLVGALFGSSMILAAALMAALAPQHGAWPVLALAAAGGLAYARSWPRRAREPR